MSVKIISVLGVRICAAVLVAAIGPFLPLALDDTAVYYLLSSIFQGLAAVLGLFLVLYVFLENTIWQHSVIGGDETTAEVLRMKKALPQRALCLTIQLSIAIFLSLGELAIAPMLVSAPEKIGVFFVGLAV